MHMQDASGNILVAVLGGTGNKGLLANKFACNSTTFPRKAYPPAAYKVHDSNEIPGFDKG